MRKVDRTCAEGVEGAARPVGVGAAEEQAASATIHELYREHSPTLVARLARRTGCREAALELANESFLRMIRLGPAKLGAIQQPAAFLYQVSTNLLRDWGRSRRLGQRAESGAVDAADGQVDQVRLLESRDTLRRLEQALERMKPKTREIFLAQRIEGLSYAEIAERTGLSVKGVEKQMSKAIAKIDRVLDRN